ncbi:MAG TPA: CocE/NonD family hydrolase [Puia sp.]|nr:CocE/NonD family hydrolase [Puia sp.]
MNREIPFDFILDYLLRIETEVRPFFGMFAVYSGQKLLLMLRERNNEPEMNGIWIAVGSGHAALKAEMPGLRPYPGSDGGKKDNGWLQIHPDLDNFEQLAIRICELIVHRDPRIGRIPPPKRKRPASKRNGPIAKTARPKSKPTRRKPNGLGLILILLFFTLPALSQQLYFPRDAVHDSTAMSQAMSALARQTAAVIASRPHQYNIPYYAEFLRYRIITGQYADALAFADSAKALFPPKDSAAAASNVFPFRVYAATRLVMDKLGDTDFPRSFEPVFTSLYEPLSLKAGDWAENYYRSELSSRRQGYFNDISRIKASQKDSLSLAEARRLCFDWMNYVVYGAEIPLVDGLLRTIAKRQYVVEDSILIPTRDGAKIAATILRSRSVTGPQPVVLKFGIYASPSEISETKYIAGHGFIGVVADTRGKRLSPQSIEPFIHDANDAYDIIDWISRQPWCNGKIGMFGGSYVGFATWAATRHLHPALKTIVPIAAVGPGIDWPALAGVQESGTETLHWLRLVMDNKFTNWNGRGPESHWDSVARRYYTSGVAFRSVDSLEGHPNPTYQEILRHPGFDSYWSSMIPNRTDFARIHIPILTITGYYDDDQRGALYYFDQHHRYDPKAEHYLLIGPYDHGGVQGYPADPPVNLFGYHIDSVAQVSIMDVVFQWFDHVLKGGPLPDLLQDRINVEVMGDNRWRHVPALQRLNNDTLDFYLRFDRNGNRHLLVSAEPDLITPRGDPHASAPADPHASPHADPLIQTVYLADRSDSANLDGYYINGNGPILSKTLNPGNYLTFVSDTIRRAFDLNGSFVSDLEASINKKDMDIAVDLYQQTADGRYFQLSNNVFRCSYLADPTHRHLLTPGQPTHLYFENSFFASRHIEQGSRLILLLGVNKNSDWQINYGTGKDVNDETIKDAGEPLQIRWLLDRCRIRLPVWWEIKR